MKKKLLFQISVFASILVGLILSPQINAQEALPPGGDSFETAAFLPLGEYQDGTLEDGKEWYYLIDDSVNLGQEIQIKNFFTGATLVNTIIYDQNKQRLAKAEMQKGGETNTVSWLNGGSEPEKCYLILSNEAIHSATFKNVSVKITDRFDASSQTDAGNSFKNALPIEVGQYKSFLDFNYKASDNEDFYKISVPRGQKLTVRVTPPKDLHLDLKIYDKNRSELVNEYSENKGAIVTGSIQALVADTFYIAVAPKYGSGQNQASQYSLDVSGAAPNKQKSGIANLEEKTNRKPLSGSSLPQASSFFLASIGKNLKFILLIVATVLIIIVVTVVLLLGKSGKKKTPKEEKPVETEKVKEEKKEMNEPEFIYCSKCGAKNPTGARFCSKCGEKLV